MLIVILMREVGIRIIRHSEIKRNMGLSISLEEKLSSEYDFRSLGGRIGLDHASAT